MFALKMLLRFEGVRINRATRECFKRCRANELKGRLRHNHSDLRATLDKSAAQVRGFVGGDSARDAQKDLATAKDVDHDSSSVEVTRKDETKQP
jgi:hypothetical protein